MNIIDMKVYNKKNIYSDKNIILIKIKENLERSQRLADLCIKIQRLIGYNLVEFTECEDKGDHVQILVEHDNQKVIKDVVFLAIDCIDKNLRLEDMQDKILKLKKLVIETELSPNVRLLKNACIKRGIRFTRIGFTNTYILGEGKWAKVFNGLLTDIEYQRYMLSQDREIQRRILQSHNLPTPRYQIVYTQEEFLDTIKKMGYPITIKGTQKTSPIFLNIRTQYQAIECFNQIKNYEQRVMVERFIKGESFKLLVINGKMMAAIKRTSPYIIGDGIKKIEQLLNDKERNDRYIQKTILKQGFNLDDVLPKGMKIFLKEASGFKNNCIIEDVTQSVHPLNQKVICDAIDSFGYQFGCVDFIIDDITIPYNVVGGYIVDVELNTDMRLFSQNCDVDIFNTLLDVYFEKMSNPSIPSFIVSGTYGKSTVLKIINYILMRCGFNVSIEKDIEDFYIKNISDDSDIKLIEFDPSSNIEEIDVDPIVGIITNTRNEKQIDKNLLIARSIHEKGYLILNVDDKYKYLYCSKSHANIVFVSVDNDHPDLRAHMEQKKSCVYLKNGTVTIYDGKDEFGICDISMIPYSYNGRLKFAIENILQVVAALFFYGVDIEIIYKFLIEYKNDSHQNPGKFNIFDINGIKVIIDDIKDEKLIHIVVEALREIGIDEVIFACDENIKEGISCDNSKIFYKKIHSFNDVIDLVGEAMKSAKKGSGVFILLPEPFNRDMTYEIRERLSTRKKNFV